MSFFAECAYRLGFELKDYLLDFRESQDETFEFDDKKREEGTN
jgi:hypothetical protein